MNSSISNSPIPHRRAFETALAHHHAGRLAEAEAIYKKILVDAPDDFDALHLLGVLYYQTGKSEAAVGLISRALEQNAQHPEALNNLGAACRACRRPNEAEGYYRRAIAINPNYAEAHNNLGNVLMDLARLPEAETAFRRAIAVKPDYAEAHNSLGSLLRDQGRLQEAEAVYRRAIAINPRYTEVHNNLGNTLKNLMRLPEAEAAYRQALAIKPEFAVVQWNLSLLKLLQGHFEEGLELYEKRFEGGSRKIFKSTNDLLAGLKDKKRWQGEALEDRTLLVISEQGAGDNLMMMRYLPLLVKLNIKLLVVYSHPALKRVFANIPGGNFIDVVPITESLPFDAFDLYCPIMSLPYVFNTRLDTIPNKVPYLSIPEEMKHWWRTRLEEITGVKVGLVWAGGKLASTDKNRSIPLKKFAPLTAIEGVRWVSLQKGEESAELKELGWDLIDWMEECEDYLETAALVDQLDLVISVDTSVAHLAGALGKPVWLLNRFNSEWRWLLGREDSPWYPSMRIFRQKERGDWEGVIKLVAEELVKFPIRTRGRLR